MQTAGGTVALWHAIKRAVGAEPTCQSLTPRVPVSVCRYIERKVQTAPGAEYLAERATFGRLQMWNLQ